MKHKDIFIIIIIFVILTGCASKIVQPTSTISAPTFQTAAQQPTTIPEGFEQKYISDLNINVLVPTGWFYKWVPQSDTKAFFITKEDIDVTGRFSTGLTVNIEYDVENVDETAWSFITTVANQSITKKVLGEGIKSSNKTNTMILYGVTVEAELPVSNNDPNPNPEKTLSYFSIADIQTNTLYLMIFESPRNEWDSEWNQFGVEVTFSVINAIFGE
jgi:hypothetical protein